MSAKRITQSSIEWAKIAERVHEADKGKLLAFRAKSDSYLRRMLANPEAPPKLDWGHYKKVIPVAGLVDNFQKQYEALKVPYPADTVTSQIDAQENEVKQEIAQFKKESAKRIEEYRAQAAHLNSLLPYDQMTMEDFFEAHPEEALDPINKPTFWPHNKEEQLDYKPEEQQPAGH